jgi:hypothetical protein
LWFVIQQLLKKCQNSQQELTCLGGFFGKVSA